MLPWILFANNSKIQTSNTLGAFRLPVARLSHNIPHHDNVSPRLQDPTAGPWRRPCRSLAGRLTLLKVLDVYPTRKIEAFQKSVPHKLEVIAELKQPCPKTGRLNMLPDTAAARLPKRYRQPLDEAAVIARRSYLFLRGRPTKSDTLPRPDAQSQKNIVACMLASQRLQKQIPKQLPAK